MKLVYFGTSEFAEEPLRRLLKTGAQVVAVVTQPDRPKGRGRRLQRPPVKIIAEESDLSIEQPEDPNSDSFVSTIEEYEPDAIVVVAYVHKLGPRLLGLPQKGCFNIHPSLLPLYRGAAPINWAIIEGEKITGVSVIRMNERFDAGEILMQESVEIGEDETAGELSVRLSNLGSELIVKVLEAIQQGSVRGTTQEEAKVTKAPRIKKIDCEVAWSKTAVEIKNLVRGLHPKPGAYSYYKDKLIKLARANALTEDVEQEPGEIVRTDDGIDVASGKGVVRLLSLQPEGKREMSWVDFRNGFRPLPGDRFGRP
jgi:methionyl-tRNA formyltransferase